MASEATIGDRFDEFDISWRDLIAGLIVSIVPAFGLYMIISMVMGEAQVWAFYLAIVGFTVIFHRPEGITAKIGGGLFYLAIEAFIAPIAILIFTFTFASQQAGPFAQAGAAISGGIMFIIAWFLSWTVGIVLYLLSSRLEG